MSHLCLLVWTTQKHFILLQNKCCKYWDLVVLCSSLIQNQHLLMFADDCIQLTSQDQDAFRSFPETPKDFKKSQCLLSCLLPPVTAALCVLRDDVNHPQTCFAWAFHKQCLDHLSFWDKLILLLLWGKLSWPKCEIKDNHLVELQDVEDLFHLIQVD